MQSAAEGIERITMAQNEVAKKVTFWGLCLTKMEANFFQIGGQFSSQFWRPIFGKREANFFFQTLASASPSSILEMPNCLHKPFARLRGQFFAPTDPRVQSDFSADFFWPQKRQNCSIHPSEKLAEKSASKSAVGGRVSGPGFQLQFWILGGRRSRLVCRGW